MLIVDDNTDAARTLGMLVETLRHLTKPADVAALAAVLSSPASGARSSV